MQKPSEKTEKMFLVNTEKEVFDVVIQQNHPFRKLNGIIKKCLRFVQEISHETSTLAVAFGCRPSVRGGAKRD